MLRNFHFSQSQQILIKSFPNYKFHPHKKTMTQNDQLTPIVQSNTSEEYNEQLGQLNIKPEDETDYIKSLGIESMNKQQLVQLQAEILLMKDCSFKTKVIRYIKLNKKQLECFNSLRENRIQKQGSIRDNSQQYKNWQNEKTKQVNLQKKTSYSATPTILLVLVLLVITLFFWRSQ